VARGGSGITMTLKGDKELQKQLLALSPKIQKKLYRSSMRKAMKPVLSAAKNNVPVFSGALKGSLKIRSAKRKRGRIRIEVRTTDGFFKGDEFYGGFMELGTSKLPARPFLRPALQEKESIVIATLISEIRKLLPS